jgi:hypothetical protein
VDLRIENMELPVASVGSTHETSLDRRQKSFLEYRVNERDFQRSDNRDLLYIEMHVDASFACLIRSVIGKYSHGVVTKVLTA